MLLPICEECYKKIVEMKPRAPPPQQEPGMLITDYFRLFQTYLETAGNFVDTESKNKLFVSGLSDENREEVSKLPFISARLKTEDFMRNTVSFLLEMNEFKSVFFGKRDRKLADKKHQ